MSTWFQVEFSCCHCLRMSVSIWSAKGDVKERFSTSNNGTYVPFQKSDSYWDSNALIIQQSHKAPAALQDSPALWSHWEMLPPSPLYQSHVLSCRCSWVFGELPKGSLTAMLQCCTCLVNHNRALNTLRFMDLPATCDRFTTSGPLSGQNTLLKTICTCVALGKYTMSFVH